MTAQFKTEAEAGPNGGNRGDREEPTARSQGGRGAHEASGPRFDWSGVPSRGDLVLLQTALNRGWSIPEGLRGAVAGFVRRGLYAESGGDRLKKRARELLARLGEASL